MKKRIFSSILLLALCVVAFGAGCRGRVTTPCENETYKPLSGATITGVGDVVIKKIGKPEEKIEAVYPDYLKFFELNPQYEFDPARDTPCSFFLFVTGEEVDNYDSNEAFFSPIQSDDCGYFFPLKGAGDYAVKIGLIREVNGEGKLVILHDLIYPDNEYECPLDSDYICFNPANL